VGTTAIINWNSTLLVLSPGRSANSMRKLFFGHSKRLQLLKQIRFAFLVVGQGLPVVQRDEHRSTAHRDRRNAFTINLLDNVIQGDGFTGLEIVGTADYQNKQQQDHQHDHNPEPLGVPTSER
jgi:hypothetical protein